jgi:aryl-alcohol dehydrogenase-like predicted oxidoreductase
MPVPQAWRPEVRLGIGIADHCRHGVPNLQQLANTVVEHAAVQGIRLVDTADAYAPDTASFGLGEVVVRNAVNRLEPAIRPTVMTKGGHTRNADNSWSTNGGYGYLRTACHASIDRLAQLSLPLYALHRPDPAVNFSESLDALASLVAEGAVQAVALSNVSAQQIRLGRAALGEALVGVQNELSVLRPAALPELQVCEELGLTFFAWAPLGGAGRRADLNALFADSSHVRSPQQWALSWLLSLSELVVPVVGVSRPQSIDAALVAVTTPLNAAEQRTLNRRLRLL